MTQFENVVVTSQDCFSSQDELSLFAYDPNYLRLVVEPLPIEPGQAVRLPAAERARMNRAIPGINPPAEEL